ATALTDASSSTPLASASVPLTVRVGGDAALSTTPVQSDAAPLIVMAPGDDRPEKLVVPSPSVNTMHAGLSSPVLPTDPPFSFSHDRENAVVDCAGTRFGCTSNTAAM